MKWRAGVSKVQIAILALRACISYSKRFCVRTQGMLACIALQQAHIQSKVTVVYSVSIQKTSR
jgi:hypothetical protein